MFSLLTELIQDWAGVAETKDRIERKNRKGSFENSLYTLQQQKDIHVNLTTSKVFVIINDLCNICKHFTFFILITKMKRKRKGKILINILSRIHSVLTA